MKLIVTIAALILLATFILLIFWVASLKGRNALLKKRVNELEDLIGGLNRPELWLSQDERREHAKKLLQRDLEKRDIDVVQSFTPPRRTQ